MAKRGPTQKGSFFRKPPVTVISLSILAAKYGAGAGRGVDYFSNAILQRLLNEQNLQVATR